MLSVILNMGMIFQMKTFGLRTNINILVGENIELTLNILIDEIIFENTLIPYPCSN